MTEPVELWDNDGKKTVMVYPVKKEGKNLIAFCPFHNDKKRPNLSIDTTNDTYHCFACGRSGHLYDQDYQKNNHQHRKIPVFPG